MKTLQKLWILFALPIFSVVSQAQSNNPVKKSEMLISLNSPKEAPNENKVYNITEEKVVTDIDNNSYNIVRIGSQVWMKENLKTTRYGNGNPIETTVPLNKDISNETAPKYQWTYNDNDSLTAKFGLLYTWYVATDNRNVCPEGWRVPSKNDFVELANFLGGSDSAGIKLKESGAINWKKHDIHMGNNATGFSAVAGGFRTNESSNEYKGLESGCYFWTTTKDNPPYACHAGLFYDVPNLFISSSYHPDYHGFSIRCVKNSNVSAEQ